MGEIRKIVVPVKLFCGLIVTDRSMLSVVKENLSNIFGSIDAVSDELSFTHTHYYGNEMGKNLVRKWISFHDLISPEQLAHIKITTNEIERQYADFIRNGHGRDVIKRKANIDPGYIGYSKVVLATTKDYDHRLYLHDGIFAEVTLHYKRAAKCFQPWPWTYPDYREKTALDFFNTVREIYRSQVREECP